MNDQPRARAYDTWYNEYGKAKRANRCRDQERHPAPVHWQQRASGYLRKVRQLARYGNDTHCQQRRDYDGHRRDDKSLYGVQAHQLRHAHASTAQQGDIILAALHEVRHHHRHVVQDRDDHDGQQQQQRNAREEAAPLEPIQKRGYAAEYGAALHLNGHAAFKVVETHPQFLGPNLLQRLLINEYEPG